MPPPVGSTRSGSFWRSWKGVAVVAAATAVVAGTFVVPSLLGSNGTTTAHSSTSDNHGKGLAPGSAVPAFTERNVVTGAEISSKTVYGQKTLLFFSEGVMCQACFAQIRDIEQVGTELAKRGIRLVSITPDTSSELAQMIVDYGIKTPMIADDDGSMSAAFNTIGLGMHGDTPGHAFALVDRGRVLWYRDYWLPPTRSMYVKPATLLADIPT